MQVNASLQNQNKFAYGLAKGCQTDSQVAKSRKFHAYHWLMLFYNNRLLAINLCRLTLGGQTVKNLRLLASKFELDQSQRNSMQVDASPRKWVAKRNETWTQVQNLRRLTSSFGQGFKSLWIMLTLRRLKGIMSTNKLSYWWKKKTVRANQIYLGHKTCDARSRNISWPKMSREDFMQGIFGFWFLIFPQAFFWLVTQSFFPSETREDCVMRIAWQAKRQSSSSGGRKHNSHLVHKQSM